MDAGRVADELARRSVRDFAACMDPQMQWTPFHCHYYRLLDLFARGRIRRLMVSVPPQHGKSRGASQMLPAYLLGHDPDLRIAIASYSAPLARRFGAGVQRLMFSYPYSGLFPGTRLRGSGEPAAAGRGYRCAASEFDCVGRRGGVLAVGRAGPLTGREVDVIILDDLYKNTAEGHSPLVRDQVWEWYNAVVRTRLHNDSRELVVFTRWHEDDLAGRLLRSERVICPQRWEELESVGEQEWVMVNFEALKATPPTEIDPRSVGEALWPARHSASLLENKQRGDPVLFEALYQGNPTAREDLLYGEFATYAQLPPSPVRIANYTDTADTGRDRLCSVCYQVDREGYIYLTDVLHTARPMEETEVAVAAMLKRNAIREALFESNNGGRGFARAVERLAGGCTIRTFHQSASKEARILSNSATVMRLIRMPPGWQVRWPGFAAELAGFRRTFRANRHDDAADALTGIVETECERSGGRISRFGFTR